MKLKKGFLLHDVLGEHMAVAVGPAAAIFNGMIRNNETAHFIFQQLLTDTTEEQIVTAMEAKYDAPRDRIATDVHALLEKLRQEGFLDE